MVRKLFEIIILFSLVFCLVNANFRKTECVPEITKFYWKTPCDDQKFDNVIIVTSLTATQNGQDVDVLGGLDLQVPLKFNASIQDKYGVINTPLIDIQVFEYKKRIVGKTCEWVSLPTLGILRNKDACTMVDNCHLVDNPTTLTATVNFEELSKILVEAAVPGNYYGYTMTFKDKDKQLLCLYTQSKVVKK